MTGNSTGATARRVLRDDMRCLMNLILDGSDEWQKREHIPDHYCGYIYAPDGGACDFHEWWFKAAERCGLMDQWAEEDASV